MKPPAVEWRRWLYTMAMLGGGVAMTALAIWLITLVRWGWTASNAPQQLAILGNALLLAMGGAGLVLLGLLLRTTIRSIKGSAGADGFSLEADSHQEEQP